MSDLNDIVAVGLDLTAKTLIQAYSEGIFPWPTEGLPLLWYFPKQRGILEFEHLHIARRMHSFLKKTNWTYTVNRAFREVIEACGDRGRDGTWILPEMKAAYSELHSLGHAHSIEVWEDGQLIGGIYGVDVAGYFVGESMFHRKANASKAAFFYAVALQKKAGRTWMDVQVPSPHLETLGVSAIPESEFKKRLKDAKTRLRQFGPDTPFKSGSEVTWADYSMIIE
jgi:leucyl/phenylalanyl-tRNA--protein transferase